MSKLSLRTDKVSHSFFKTNINAIGKRDCFTQVYRVQLMSSSS